MAESFWHLLAPLAGLSLNVLLQVAGFRFFPGLSLLKSVFLGFFFGLAFMVAFEVLFFVSWPSFSWNSFWGTMLSNLLTYFALGYGYFHFINLGETARRVRILRELHDSPQGLSLPEILARYNGKNILQYRMERLLANGQVIIEQGKYKIGNPSMLLITRIMIFLKRIIIGKESEFD